MRKWSLRILVILALAGLAFIPLSGEFNRWGLIFAVFTVIPAVFLFGVSFINKRILHVVLTILAALLGIAGMSFLLITTALDYGMAELFDVSALHMIHGIWITWLIFWILLFLAIAGKKEGKRKIGFLIAGILFAASLLLAGILFAKDKIALPGPEGEEQTGPYAYTEEEISQDEETGISYVNDIIMVFFTPDTPEEEKQAVVDALEGEIAGQEEVIDLLMIRVEASSYEELEALCEEVRQMEGVQEASLDLAAFTAPNYEPNDPFGRYWYNCLWTDNKWDVESPSGNNWWAEAIDAPGAWEHKDKMASVSVGIVDNGFDIEHEDLSVGLLNEGVNSYEDHGTHVSGLVGATMDNKKGIAGVAPNARMLGWDWEPTKVQTEAGGWSTSSSILSGVVASIEEGGERTVVNLSLGIDPKGLKESTGSDVLGDEYREYYGALVSKYMAALLVRDYDFVIVESAGNGDASGIGYDAKNNGYFCSVTEENCDTFGGAIEPKEILDRIIIVAAAAQPDKKGDYTLCRFSNYGESVTIAAPGEDIYSTTVDGYKKMDGTSMASPITAGAAAAVWGAQPNLSGAQIKEILVDSSEIQVSPNEATDAKEGIALLNVGNAVEKALETEVEETDNSVYETYIKAAEITTVRGNWTEKTNMEMEVQAENGRDTYRVNGESETEISGFDRHDISKVYLEGEGYSSNENTDTRWEMRYADGVVRYEYIEPVKQDLEQEIQPEFFNFFNLKEASVLNGKMEENEISFELTRDSFESAAGAVLIQLSQNESFSYDKVTLSAQIDSSSGQLNSQTIEIVGSMDYEGSKQYTECVLEYRFEAEEIEEGDLVPGNGDMSQERDIVLVLDNSGSMAESVVDEGASSDVPIEETREAAVKFIDTILEEDASIGIVTYNNGAKMCSDFSKEQGILEASAYTITANGGTNMEAGLNTAEEMLSYSSAKKKIIVLMSDGMPNDGKQGTDLVSYADSLKEDGIDIYTLGFFSSLEEGERASAQSLLAQLASEGHHYEVDDAENLVFFFDDIADMINGQKYIYIKIACPVDVTVKSGGETLTSEEKALNTRTTFGTLTFEEGETDTVIDSGEDTDSSAAADALFGFIGEQESKQRKDGEEEDDRVKILRLKEGTKYDIQIEGTGNGSMDYTIGFMDENGEYTDFREFEDIEITRRTQIDTVAENTSKTVLKVDEDGDGKYEWKYRAGINERGKLVDNTWILYVVAGAAGIALILVIVLKVRHWQKKKK